MDFFLDLLFAALTELFAGLVAIVVSLLTEFLSTLLSG